MTEVIRIRTKDRNAILQALRAGVVPRLGIHHIQVGRVREINSLMTDINTISDGGSGIRFVIGPYGSGKTFFLHLIRSIAVEKGLVTAYADFTPDRRIHATAGQARSLYAEMMKNVSTRSKPDGGALQAVVEKFITSTLAVARESNTGVEMVIRDKLAQLSELVGGYDFAQIIARYWQGHDTGNDQLKSEAIRWLRGEYTTKTDARNALGVRTIIEDANVYDHLKLMARFVRLAGYGGLLVGLDELVNLYKMSNTQARNANYEQILRILNDSLQGTSVGLGFILCGTPDFLLDTRRGLYSYQALQTRLAENTFASTSGVEDFTGPVIRLGNLSKEDLYVLLMKVRSIYAEGDPSKYLLPDEALKSFMVHCSKRIGDAYFQTPRNTIRSFIDLLSVLDQDKNIPWDKLIERIPIEKDVPVDLAHTPSDDIQDRTQSSTERGVTPDDDKLTKFKL